MDAADCKQAACCFYKYTKRIFMLKYMININFNTIYVNILQKQEKYTFEILKYAYRIYMETKRYLILRQKCYSTTCMDEKSIMDTP